MSVSANQRFRNRESACPVCGGYDNAPRGQGMRCHGYLSEDGRYCFCSREEHAGSLQPRKNGLFRHYLAGPCYCGHDHRAGPYPSGSQRRRVVAHYDYQHANGTLLLQVVKYMPKEFRLRRPDGNGGWIWDLEGVTSVLYRLPELLDAPAEATIFIPEGEKDVERLVDQGLLATCSPMGAGKWHRLTDLEPLRSRQVVILADNDEPGRSHARQVAQSLQGIASSITILELPGLPEKGDVSDWLDQGHSVQELQELAEAADEWVPGSQSSIGEDWPEPNALPMAGPPVPTIPPSMIPAPLRAWLYDVATHACLPIEMIAVPALVSAATTVGRKIAIRPGKFDDFTVVANLWGTVVAPPASLKSYANK
jgi:hypothetical protein